MGTDREPTTNDPKIKSTHFQISDQSQLELSTEFPLGEGNFGVVYKGVLLRSNGEWDQVRGPFINYVTKNLVISLRPCYVFSNFQFVNDFRF